MAVGGRGLEGSQTVEEEARRKWMTARDPTMVLVVVVLACFATDWRRRKAGYTLIEMVMLLLDVGSVVRVLWRLGLDRTATLHLAALFGFSPARKVV